MGEVGYTVTGISTLEAEDQRAGPDLWADHVTDMQGEFGYQFLDTEQTFWAASEVQVRKDRIVARFASTAMRYRRTNRQTARDGDGSLRLMIPIRGHMGFTAGRHETVDLAPYSVGIFRMDRPMSLEYGDGGEGLIATVPEGILPRRLVENPPPLLDPRRPIVRMLVSHITHMNALRSTMTAREFTAGTEIMFNFLAAALEIEQEESEPATPLAQRARELARIHSDDPDFSVESIARECNTSKSTLYRTLESLGVGPAELLRTIRLEKAKERLRDPRYRTVHEVAAASGFGSYFSFHQAFLKHYATTPGSARSILLEGGEIKTNRTAL